MARLKIECRVSEISGCSRNLKNISRYKIFPDFYRFKLIFNSRGSARVSEQEIWGSTGSSVEDGARALVIHVVRRRLTQTSVRE